MLSGTLKFVPTQAKGVPGAIEAKPATVTVSLARHLALKWVALLFVVLFMLPGNRTPRALWVLAPLAAVYLMSEALLGLAERAGLGSQAQIFQPMRYYGFLLAAAWLTLKGRRWAAFLMSAVALAAASFLATLAMPADLRALSISLVFFAVIVWLGLLLTAWQCRRRFSKGRFFWRLPLSLIAASLMSMGVYFVFMLIVEGRRGAPRFTEIALIMLGFSLAFGVVFYVVTLPFCVLSFASPFFRARFEPLFHRPAPPAPAMEEAQAEAETTVEAISAAEAIKSTSDQEGGQ